MDYAYGRVSASDQNLARQIEAFMAFGIKTENIYCDKLSGKDFERDSYKNLLKKLKQKDLLVIKSIDRLGRNYDAIISEWANITKKIGADLYVLDMPILDTRSKDETLIGRFIPDIVLQLLSFVAENERNNIKSRQKEGIEIAKANGVRFGRPIIPLDEELYKTLKEYTLGDVTLDNALAITQMKKSTFYYQLNKYKKRYS